MTLTDLRDAGVVFPYFPSAYAVGDLLDLLAGYNRTIRLVAEEEKVPMVDLAKSFDALPDPRPYFFDTMHTNPKGMALIAEDVATVLERQGLVGPRSEASTAATGGAP
jgi:hypothetical protein